MVADDNLTGIDWYAIHTRSRHESAVYKQLQQKHIETFLPTIPRWSRWKDRRKRIDWPLFAGYCFARFNGMERLPILTCTGVLSIVSFEGRPAPIPEYQLNSVRVLVEGQLQYDVCPLIHEGTLVEVMHGPLQGMVGRLIRKDVQHASVVLSVDLIGQALRIEVAAGDIRPH